MSPADVAALLGPRYSWAIHTEPVKRMMDYATALEAKLCQCAPEPGPRTFYDLPGHVSIPK